MGPLVPLFWTSGDVYSGLSKTGWIPYLCACSPTRDGFLRFISGVAPAELLMPSIVAEPF